MASKGFYDQGPDNIEWQTPEALFDQLWEEAGGFDLDPCCQRSHYTAKRVRAAGGTIYTPKEDGLAQAWQGKVFMNPPYARGELAKWVRWGHAQAVYGRAESVWALLPVRTDTRWWQEFVCSSVGPYVNGAATEVRFLPGRLTFVGANNQARFASAVVIWGKVSA